MTHGVYEVTPGHTFRGRGAGEQFEAPIDRPREVRAVSRGVLRLIDTLVPALVPGSYTFPDGWLASPHTTTEAPRGAFFMDRKE